MNKKRKTQPARTRTRKLSTEVFEEESRHRTGRFWRNAGVALLVLASLGTTGWLTWKYSAERYLYSNPHYTLRHLEVEVTGRVTREQVLAWAQVREGANLYDLDVQSIQAQLREQPGIAEAEVRRVIPDTLEIKVTARNPVARLTQEGVPGIAYLVDAEGYVMKPVFEDRAENLPEVRGTRPGEVAAGRSVGRQEALAALRLLRLAEEAGAQMESEFQSVDISQPGVLLVTIDNGSRIRFSTDSAQHAAQMKRFEQILNWCTRNQRKLGTADLTVARNVPVTFLEDPAAPTLLEDADADTQAPGRLERPEHPPVNRNPGAHRG